MNLSRSAEAATPAGRVSQHFRLSGKKLWEKSHIVGVVCHRDEIKRTSEFGALACGRLLRTGDYH